MTKLCIACQSWNWMQVKGTEKNFFSTSPVYDNFDPYCFCSTSTENTWKSLRPVGQVYLRKIGTSTSRVSTKWSNRIQQWMILGIMHEERIANTLWWKDKRRDELIADETRRIKTRERIQQRKYRPLTTMIKMACQKGGMDFGGSMIKGYKRSSFLNHQ